MVGGVERGTVVAKSGVKVYATEISVDNLASSCSSVYKELYNKNCELLIVNSGVNAAY